MKRTSLILLVCCLWILNVSCGSGDLFQADKKNALRAPSYPLIMIDPYTSVWSFTDNLNEDVTRHWTGKEQSLLGVLEVDGTAYRFMGKESPAEGAPERFTTAAVQQSVNVLPTQTYYTFACGPVSLDLVFTAPLLLDDLDRMSTPVNYISWQVRSTDGKAHQVRMVVEASPALAVHSEEQAVTTAVEEENGISYLKTGTVEQAVLARKGDDVRIDWGYFYLAAQTEKQTGMKVSDRKQLVYSHDPGSVSASPVSGYLMVGYDDLYAVQYFKDNRMAYWKHNGEKNIRQAFEEASAQYRSVMNRCRRFDSRLMKDAEKAGGKEYAELCAVAYRQAIAAHKLVEDADGNLLFLSKENFSNGSIGTVDVTYPSAPLFLLYNPELLKGMLNPIFYYSESGQWNKPFAAHDVGTYPQANGQTYPYDMPVEESGNMLILTTAIALREGNAEYARRHWDVLTVWANYLLKEGLDPENQLCTDDFAGHLAHNANLSIKAIMGIAGYGKLAGMLGDKEQADRYIAAARKMAEKWERMADDGDHFRLTFDRENTWSQKYNLVWDKVLGLQIFPDRIARKEVAFYLTRQQPFGLPLDSRKTYTKVDWILWTACLADTEEDFSRLVSPAYKYVNETEPRVPLTDWYEATDGRSINMRARSVVGGFFMKMLEQQMCKPSSRPQPAEQPAAGAKTTYRNPVIDYSLPDPTIIKADNGYFYLYATEDIRNTPIHRSRNLVDWEEVGTAFTEETRPTFEPKGGLWAPDINYINGQYVLYYSMSVWGGEWTCGIGVATSDKPEGPFTDHGPLFRSKTIQVQNSIDQFYMEDNGKKYLFWGSFRGIYGIELSGDGLSVRDGAVKQQVAGTAYEGTYIHKRGNYYYLFASIGSCCEGLKSTYTTVVGRSDNLFGPYTDKQGQPMMENHHEILIHGNEAFVGTGHNSEIVADDRGNDWILYHAVSRANPTGRVLMLDRVRWKDGWPEVEGVTPSLEAEAPTFLIEN
ncbi:family 43 glycosylhydrolase [uncultured Parabacteroides sp.]|uniref:glutaminase domain-containing protein n=1 Tax=uncultured Parabacteroides sp. TaxID=512312 RepID=UPI003437F7C0